MPGRVREQRFSNPFPSDATANITGVSADANTIMGMWAEVARAAADHRRIVAAGDEVFYDDLTLRRTGDAHAWGQLTRAIRRALDARVAEEEILDALMSGDPRSDRAAAIELIEYVRVKDDRLRELDDRILRDMFGERD
jgi:hypothetical protein